MSQRLIKPGMSAAEQFRKRNPLHIIGYTRRGPVWSIAGGAEDGDPPDPGDGGGGKVQSGGTGGDDTDPDDDADDDGDDTDDDGKPKGKVKDDDDDGEETVPKWKYEKLHTRMTAADRRASDLQKALDDLKSSKDINADVKKELEDIKTNVKTIEADRDKAREHASSLTIRLAALTLKNAPDWEDVETALKLADLSDVDVSDDGKVDRRALRSALNALAKEKPYLVKKSTGDGGGTGGGNGRSAPAMGGRRTGAGQAPDAEALAKRFPVLARK